MEPTSVNDSKFKMERDTKKLIDTSVTCPVWFEQNPPHHDPQLLQ